MDDYTEIWVVFMENLDDNEIHGVYATEELARAEWRRRSRRDRSVIPRWSVDGPYKVISEG